MNELNLDTGENFIQPSGRKHLEELFDVEIKPARGDESLRYSPPRASNNETETTRSPWQTLLAKMVLGFKNGGAFGRVGIAILKNIDNAHRIILYKSKANMLAVLTLTQDQLQHRVYLHRQNCYWQFYDDFGIYWSLLFERSADESEFVSKLQSCGFKMHLDVDVIPETVVPAEEYNGLEAGGNEENELEQLQNESGKQVKNKNDLKIDPAPKDTIMLTESGYDRTNLLKRLSKIGVQQLPPSNSISNIKNTATEGSDSDQDSSGDRCSTLTLVGQPYYPTCTQTASSSKNVVLHPVETQVMQMMLLENRTQNTELRINLDKLDNKLERVLGKMDKFKTKENQEDEVIKLEEQILELKKENRRLKKEYRDVTERSDVNLENVWRIYETELNSLGLSRQANAYAVETLIGELLDKLSIHKNEIREKELQLKSTLTTAKELNDRYQIEKKSHNETIEKMEHMLEKLKSLQATVDAKTKNDVELFERINELNSKHAAEITNVKVEMTQALKDIMNTLYHNLAKNIVDMERLVPEEILPLIGKTIRQDTLAAVAKISK